MEEQKNSVLFFFNYVMISERYVMIKIIAVGKLKEKALQMLIDEYKKRLSAYTKLEIVEVADEQAAQNNSAVQNEQVKQKEGIRILSKIKEGDYVILLDLHGKEMSSEAFASKLSEIYTYHNSNITFIIGGSLGLSKEVIERSDYRFKLSELTFTHQMVRILILEQIYRAYKINHNEPYHK